MPFRPLHGIPRPHHLHLHHSWIPTCVDCNWIHACHTSLPPTSCLILPSSSTQLCSCPSISSGILAHFFPFPSSRLTFSSSFSPRPPLSCSLGTCGGLPVVKPLLRHKTMKCMRKGLRRGAMCVPLRHLVHGPPPRRAVARERLFLCLSYIGVRTPSSEPRWIR